MSNPQDLPKDKYLVQKISAIKVCWLILYISQIESPIQFPPRTKTILK